MTFTGPSSGGSVVFSNSSNIITANTNVSGQLSEAITANTHSGIYTVNATVGGVATPAQFNMTNTPGTAVGVAVFSGALQSATVNSAFATPLTAAAVDQYGNPVPNIGITFAAPTTGASGHFSNNEGGIFGTSNGVTGLLSVAFTANTIASSYSVTATANGIVTPVSFNLTNTAGTPASIAAASGSPQIATVNTLFGSSLVATVDDVYGNPVPGALVTFTAPASGAGGTFSNSSNTITASTNASGQASEVFTANTTAASYTVTAAVSGVGAPASFSLTNTAGAATASRWFRARRKPPRSTPPLAPRWWSRSPTCTATSFPARWSPSSLPAAETAPSSATARTSSAARPTPAARFPKP